MFHWTGIFAAFNTVWFVCWLFHRICSELVSLKSFARRRGSPLTSCLQLRSLKSEGTPLWKGSAGVKSHIRGPAVSWPRPQEAGFTCAGQEGTDFSVITLCGQHSSQRVCPDGMCGWRTVLRCVCRIFTKMWRKFTVCASCGNLGLVRSKLPQALHPHQSPTAI